MKNMILLRDVYTNNIIGIEYYNDIKLFIRNVHSFIRIHKKDFVQIETYSDKEYICDLICPIKSSLEAIKYFNNQFAKIIKKRIENYDINENNIR